MSEQIERNKKFSVLFPDWLSPARKHISSSSMIFCFNHANGKRERDETENIFWNFHCTSSVFSLFLLTFTSSVSLGHVWRLKSSSLRLGIVRDSPCCCCCCSSCCSAAPETFSFYHATALLQWRWALYTSPTLSLLSPCRCTRAALSRSLFFLFSGFYWLKCGNMCRKWNVTTTH